MKKYEMWKQVRDEMQESVDRLSREVVVNTLFLKAAQKELDKIPKPKDDSTTRTITG